MKSDKQIQSVKEVKEVLEIFNKEHVDYVLMRNYEFLFGQKPGKDIDIVIFKKDCIKVEKILLKLKYYKQKICPFSNHTGFYKFIFEEEKLIKFHFHTDGISGRHAIYLNANDLFKTKKLVKGIPVISSENTLILLAIHSNLGKNARKSYVTKVNEILDKDFDKGHVRQKLNSLIGKNLTQEFLKFLYSRKFDDLAVLKRTIKKKLFFKNTLQVFKIRFFCVLWKLKHLIKGAPVISFIGMDGAGKTTLTMKIKKVFKKNNMKVSLIYTGRGKNNLLPIQKFGRPYKKIEKKLKIPKTLIKFMYVLFSPVFFFDLLLRFFLVIYPAKLRNDIVLTDRFSSDVLLMKHVPDILRQFYYIFLPKPTILFYIYNNIETLHKRKPDHPFEDLKRQEILFEKINKKIEPVKIKNEKLEFSKNKILKKIFKQIRI